MDYASFLADFDKRLLQYFEQHKQYIMCKVGCCLCCKKGDYPMSQMELEYLMQGYIILENNLKTKIQENVKNIKPGGICPFLINKKCSVYDYRPIICRVHGLAYLCKNNIVKTPYCVKEGKNYFSVYESNEIVISPIIENLDTPSVLKDFNYGEIRNLYDWIKVI